MAGAFLNLIKVLNSKLQEPQQNSSIRNVEKIELRQTIKLSFSLSTHHIVSEDPETLCILILFLE